MAGATQSKVVDFGGQFFAGQLLAIDGKGNNKRAVLQMLGDAFAFFGLDLSVNAFGGVVRRFLICHFNDVEPAVARKSLGILVDGVAKILFLHASRRNNVDLHKKPITLAPLSEGSQENQSITP